MKNFDSPRFLEWLIIWNGGSSGQWIQLWDGVVVALPSAFTVSLSILEHWSKECCVLDPTVCWGWPWLLMEQIVVSWQRSYITLLCPLDVWPFWILIVSPLENNFTMNINCYARRNIRTLCLQVVEVYPYLYLFLKRVRFPHLIF